MEDGLLTPAQQEQTVDLLLALHDHYHPGRVLDRGLVRNHLLDNLCGPHSQIRLVTAELGGELLGLGAGLCGEALETNRIRLADASYP